MNTLLMHKPFRGLLLLVLVIMLLISTIQSSFAATEPMVYCSYNHSLVLKEDGTVWAWGNNIYGQLGDGSRTNWAKPVQVKILQNVKAIASTIGYNYALLDNGDLYGWGIDNGYDHPVSLKITGLSDISSTDYQYCTYQLGYSYVSPTGEVLARYDLESYFTTWGQASIKCENGGFTSVVPCLAGGWLGLDSKGGVWDKRTIGSFSNRVKDLSNIISIAGEDHHAALQSDGTVWTWGSNSSGQLGDGTTIDRDIPQKVNGIDNVVQIAATGSKTFALKANGDVYVWGQSAVFDTKGQKSPDRFKMLTFSKYELSFDIVNGKPILKPTQIPELSDIKYIAAGTWHCLAIKGDGTVWAWGRNDYGQLGDGTTNNREKPVMITDFNVLTPVVNEPDVKTPK